MRKTLKVVLAITLGVTCSFSGIYLYKNRYGLIAASDTSNFTATNQTYIDSNLPQNDVETKEDEIEPATSDSNSEETTNETTTNEATVIEAKTFEASSKTSENTNIALSRGGSAPKSSEAVNLTPNPIKPELLNWGQATSVIPREAVFEVKDVYTGKIFKAKRTMGTNHIDAEALTKEDSEIIKSIWGGFNWERRPVHILINGRVLAASMSGMPHAGVDSAPAYTYVNNLSGDFGPGENLDVIKDNGMDGHFDIHFLNSTRHMDGKKDPQHQEMVKISSETLYQP